MRPAVLFPLFRSVSSLKGVGPALGEALARLLTFRPVWHGDPVSSPLLRDLIFHVPSGVTDRRRLYRAIDAPVDAGDAESEPVVASLLVTIDRHYPSVRRSGKRPPYRIVAHDDSADVQIVYFNAKEDLLRKLMPEGSQRIISGRLERFDGVLQMTHPDWVVTEDKAAQVLQLEPNYPLTYALSQKKLRELVRLALAQCPVLPEWLDADLCVQRGWIAWRESLMALHYPQGEEAVDLLSPIRQRLAYDELLANQLALALVRERNTRKKGIAITSPSGLRAEIIVKLPYQLTNGQLRVLDEIDADLASGYRMLRLLQGDVGSGKTIVALLAMLPLIEAGYQCALMVPTDILGQQHYQTFSEWLEPLGIRVDLLSGKRSTAERKQVSEGLANGSIAVAIGTHALFQQSVQFHRLGMVIIDEQHRFGVNQRLALSAKGEAPHLLLMTATPIPRSLSMTAYGDMESSLLTEKPANRLPINTRVVPLARIHEVVDGLRRAMAEGQKIYWICPLVEESAEAANETPTGDLAAAEERFRVFQSLFGQRVALAHGKMPAAERNAAIEGFAGDAFDILVATTVVEVGVDVPAASIMVIEHAERFGLAQLHQLRGRVGRGNRASSCILLYSPRVSDVARERLRVIRESHDGFHIAEEDLRLRGAGDVLGTRQSGLPDFHFADLLLHRELLLAARDDVKLILHRDAMLSTPRGEALRILLYLYGYDESLRYLQAG